MTTYDVAIVEQAGQVPALDTPILTVLTANAETAATRAASEEAGSMTVAEASRAVWVVAVREAGTAPWSWRTVTFAVMAEVAS